MQVSKTGIATIVTALGLLTGGYLLSGSAKDTSTPVQVTSPAGTTVNVATNKIEFKVMSGRKFGGLLVCNSTTSYSDPKNKPLVCTADMVPGGEVPIGKTLTADVYDDIYVRKDGTKQQQFRATKVHEIR